MLLLFAVVFVVITGSALAVQESDIVNNFVGIFSPDQSERTAARNSISNGEATPSATMALLEVVRRWNELSPEAQREISKYLAVETDSRGETRSVKSVATNGCTAVVSFTDKRMDSKHFSVYYKESGSHAATDEYIQSVINALEHSWDYELITLGLPQPIMPKGRMDVFICNLITETGGVLGVTWLTEPFVNNTCSTYLEFDNNFSEMDGYSDFSAEDYMESTVAHEFFHSIQVGINYRAPSTWLIETSAVWMQEEVFPDNNDYLNYVELLFSQPDRSIVDTSGMYYYQQHFFLRHITEHVSPAFVIDIWNNIKNTCVEGSLVSWCHYNTLETELLRDMLVEHDTDMETVHRDFYVANITKDYADGNDPRFPLVKMESAYFYDDDSLAKSGSLDRYSSALYSTGIWELSEKFFVDYNFYGEMVPYWNISLVCFKNDGSYEVSHYKPSDGKASFSSPLIDNETGCNKVVAIINNSSQYSIKRVYEIALTKRSGETLEHEMDIPAGWSLLGMPVSGGDVTPQNVSGLAGAQIFQLKDDSFVYDEESFDAPAPGMAYWVYLENEGTAHFSGFESGISEVALKRGWNFISVPGMDETAWSTSTIKLKLSDSSTLTPGTPEADKYIDPLLYEYDPGLNPPDYVSYSLEDGHVMVPGKGYMLKAHKSCSLEFPAY